MEDARLQRWLGVVGLIFVALLVVSVVTSPSLPSAHSSGAKVVASLQSHKAALRFSAVIIGVAVFEGLFFFWYLRDYLSEVPSNRRLATVGFAGVVVFAVAGGVGAGGRLALADAVGHVDPTVMQALNVLQNNLNAVLAGAGTAVFLVANGIATIRNGPLPRWQGWVAVVLGVIAIAAGAPAAALWILITSITILLRAGRSTPAPAP